MCQGSQGEAESSSLPVSTELDGLVLRPGALVDCHFGQVELACWADWVDLSCLIR